MGATVTLADWGHRQRVREVLALVAVLGVCACKKKVEEEEAPAPPRNQATLDIVATEIGTGLALRASVAPTSVHWQRVVVLDAERAVLFGRENDEAWALRTSDRGRTWTSVNALAKPWAAWGVSSLGALTLTSGTSQRPKVTTVKGQADARPKADGPVNDGLVWYAGANDRQLNGPRALFPGEGGLAGLSLPTTTAAPALFDDTIALLGEKNRTPTMIFAPIALNATLEPLPLEKAAFASAPYGRPPKLLSVAKGSIELRDWPKLGAPPGVATPIPNYRSDSTTLQQLSEGPSCEFGAFSFRLFPSPQPWVVGVSGDRALAFKVPAPNSTRLGCSEDALVLETEVLDSNDVEKRRKVPQLIRCGLDGTCTQPKAPPFAMWKEKHERELWSVPTQRGLVAILRARSATRWGLYLGQSSDGGKTFELPRTIGEGLGTRRVLEFGALIRFPTRLVLLISADVGSTGRRGWYALASDDDGNNWGPP